MPVLTRERVDEVIAGWRLGLDEDGLESPAGPLYPGGYTESEITMTGGGTNGGGYSLGGTCESTAAIISCIYECC